MKRSLVALLLAVVLPLGACGFLREADSGIRAIEVNTLEDLADPPEGVTTLRAAVSRIGSGGRVTFAPELAGGIIPLTEIGSDHSILKGEVFEMAGGWQFRGYQERDYGRSALYARKDLVIDASALPSGITVAWAGSGAPARVLAVYGDLTMKNVSVTSGWARAETISAGTQPYTLGRGGGLAVWGVATLEGCTVSGNRAQGDENGSRDRGAFGGGIYAERVVLRDCVVSGNSAMGYGAAGGGVYSVGGVAGTGQGSSLTRCAVTGNRVTAQHAYGGGVYSDGGGPGNLMPLSLTNCTIARNAVGDHPGIDQNTMSQYYYRGGGFYMSNGLLSVSGCTIAENEVTGIPWEFSGKPNMGGGGVAATIGNAHVVENMAFRQSIVAGNTVQGETGDVFTGSLRDFYSDGYNLFGSLDFRYMLVPIPEWNDLSRRHYPKQGDLDGISVSGVLDDPVTHHSILSTGTDAGSPAVLCYPPLGRAVDAVPPSGYPVSYVKAQYEVAPGGTDDFLNHALEQIRTLYADTLGADFGTVFGDMAGVTFHGPAVTWPSNPDNGPWIAFWHDLDSAIGDSLGPAGLADGYWGSFSDGPLGDNVVMSVSSYSRGTISPLTLDQLGNVRPYGDAGDVGAVERY